MAIQMPVYISIDVTQKVLQLAELDNTIQVNSMSMEPALNKGDYYTSDMTRVLVDYTRKEGNKYVKDQKSLIFKSESANDDREMKAMQLYMFNTEISMMTNILEKMIDIVGHRLCARVFYVRLTPPLCLIMEDLVPKGYQMANRTVGLDLAHCMLTIKTMATFHASSVALCEKEPKYKLANRRGLLNKSQPEKFKQFITKASWGLAEVAEKCPELGKRYADKIRNFIPKLYQKGTEASKCNENEFNVINHGDCWINNMMFRYDENKNPVDHIFVDFQACNYTSPAIDLHHFLCTSANEEIQLNKTDDLYDEYYRLLTTIMNDIGCKTRPPTIEEFRRSIAEREMYGMVVSMSFLPLILLENTKSITQKSLLASTENPGIKNPVYQSIIIKKLQRYDKMGLLD